MDGVMKELEDFFNSLDSGGSVDIGETYLQALKDTIDDELNGFRECILDGAPRDSGGLVNSLTISKSDIPGFYYGYNVEFAGETPNGEPYEKIANILNYGAQGAGKGKVNIPATNFVSRAIHRLKGLDNRAVSLAEKRLNSKLR